jgi:hypothetical protein
MGTLVGFALTGPCARVGRCRTNGNAVYQMLDGGRRTHVRGTAGDYSFNKQAAHERGNGRRNLGHIKASEVVTIEAMAEAEMEAICQSADPCFAYRSRKAYRLAEAVFLAMAGASGPSPSARRPRSS